MGDSHQHGAQVATVNYEGGNENVWNIYGSKTLSRAINSPVIRLDNEKQTAVKK